MKNFIDGVVASDDIFGEAGEKQTLLGELFELGSSKFKFLKYKGGRDACCKEDK